MRFEDISRLTITTAPTEIAFLPRMMERLSGPHIYADDALPPVAPGRLAGQQRRSSI